MGFIFRKSIKIANGVKLNVSKSGVSLSLGKKGMHYTINSKGKSTASVGLTGTGLSYRKSFDTFGALGKLFKTGEDKEDEKSVKTTKQVETAASKKNGDSLTKNETSGNAQLNSLEAQSKQASQSNVIASSDEASKYDDYVEYITRIKSFHKDCPKQIDWNALANASVPADASDSDKLSWENNIALAKEILNKDVDAYLKVINDYSSMHDIAAFGSEFEFGSDDGNTLTSHFLVKIKDVVPTVGFKKSESGKVSDFELKGSAYNDLAQDYVCSCAIRIAREVFALLPIDFLIVNAEDEVFDSSTGNNRDAVIMSVLFIRDGFDNINFDMIDPSDFVARFKTNMNFTKTNGFKEVEEIEMPKINN